MAEHERDQELSRRYAELGGEEPPARVDDAIIAAAQRAAETRPAPLVTPTGRRRWHFPVAAAAILMLAVAVTLQVEREQPDPETALPPLRKEQKQDEAKANAVPKPAVKAKPDAPRREAPQPKAAPSFTPEPAPSSAENKVERQPAAPAAPPPPAEMARDSVQRQGAPAAQPETRTRALASKVESPQEWLERIAQLRDAHRDGEADRAMEEFRRRYPEYQIPEAMLERLKKRP
jgi:hypothetical protein